MEKINSKTKIFSLLTFFLGITLIFKSCKEEKSSKNDIQWINLFDGKTTNGWRVYNGDEIPKKWTVVDGNLTFSTKLKLEDEFSGGGDIIYYKEEFENFELYVEWKLPKGGNSGILYHVKEGFNSPFDVSPEYQLLDDDGWEEINNAKLEDWQKAGADYAMYTPDENKKKLNPYGEWNTSKIVHTEKKVEHWLNGELILSFVPQSEDWYERKNSGKWKDYPDYAKFKKGYIALQDHDSPIWFRVIKLRPL
ncbi:MAG: glycosyl hydrolase [Flavobacteriaceae bacterium]|nr:glycosyl hydrolase [Flavobacteriaceae bacterium]|tara:strand:+ start:828 stop:1577 length:750 start_codon:yes stop_codon:yes gene_type:complete